jgi:hypothetical protein
LQSLPAIVPRHSNLAALDAEILPASAAELARGHASKAIRRLAYLCENAANEGVSLAAAREILDRAFGKPLQAIDSHVDAQLTISWMQPGDNARVIEGSTT